MLLKAEVIGKFDHVGDANKLLYTPLPQHLEYRETRRYSVTYEGKQSACEEFLARVLANETSHEISFGEGAALSGASFLLDYGMKPGALDLEKETIMAYYRSQSDLGFELQTLKIERRVYIYANHGESDAALQERFVKDIVNTAVHHYHVQSA